jgi:hypothetical protein
MLQQQPNAVTSLSILNFTLNGPASQEEKFSDRASASSSSSLKER